MKRKPILRLMICMAMLVASQVIYGAIPEETDVQTVCLAEGEAFEWYGKNYTNSGSYEYLEKDQYEQDSVLHILKLTVNRAYYITKRIPVCDQSSLYYNGTLYTEDTDIVENLRTVNNCDSIITTEIRFGQEFRRRDTMIIHASDAKPIYWREMEVKGPGLMTDHYINQQGCDSVYEVMVFIEEDNVRLTATTICEKDTPYVWRDYKYSDVGVYYKDDTIWTKDKSRDSLIYRLYLTINDNPERTYSINLCPGSIQTYRGKVYQTEGVYYDTIPSVTGCDTITKIVVSNLPNQIQVDSIRLWPGKTYTWRNDSTYTYLDANRQDIFISGTNQYGCDSSYRLIITYIPMFEKTEDVDFCWSKEAPYYFWHGKFQLGKDTTVYDTLLAKFETDLDTAYTLNLHMRYASAPTYLYREICSLGAGVEDFPDIKEEGVHYDTLTNQYGCDSVLVINVKYNPQNITFYNRHKYGTTVNWYGQELGAEEGIFDYIPDNHIVGLCDTIYHWNLKWWYPFARNYDDTICEQRLANGEMYIWKQDPYEIPFRLNKDANGYRDSIFYNQDSTYSLHLHVVKQNIHRDTIHLCEGSSYPVTWSDGSTRILNTEGYYLDTFPAIGANRQGCDSIIEYFVVVHKPDRRTLPDAHVADTAKQYVWEIREWNKKITLPVHKELGYEFFYDTLRSNMFGCDSVIYRLKLITDTTYFFEEKVTICHPYTWEGHLKQGKPYIVDTAGVYWDSLRTKVTNVDSVYKLVVDTFPHYLIRKNVQICQGDSTDFFGERIKTAGIYRHTDLTVDGCDSITEWILNVIPVAPPTVIEINRSDKEIPYTWERRNADGSIQKSSSYSWPGLYRDTVKSSRACDSILILDLKVWPTYEVTVKDTICASSLPYEWHNRLFNSDTVYVDSMKTVMHYDSVVTLELKVLKTDITEIPINMCFGQPYTYNNVTYTQGGRYTQRLTNSFGCDSIIVLQIKELGQIMTSQSVHVNDSFTWVVPGKPISHTYYDSGTYYDTVPASNGCDSILELRLTIHAKIVLDQRTIQECEDNLPYLWRSVKPLYNDTVLLDTVKSDITDTIHVIDFKVLHAKRDTIHPILCEGDYYDYSGKRYTRDSLIHDTTYSEFGCAKTIYSIDLRFRKVNNQDIREKTSDKEPYTWISPAGNTFIIPTKNISTRQVERTDTVRYTDGKCDSIRYHLILSIGQTYFFSDSIHLCLPDTLNWHGQQITKGGIYHDSLQTKGFAFDSIYELRVGAHNDTIIKENYSIPAGTTIKIHGIEITETGKHTKKYIDQHGCDSIYEFNVNVVEPKVVLNDEITICEGDFAPFYGKTYTKEGEYQYITQNGDSVVNLTLHVNRTSLTRLDTVIASYVNPPYVIHDKEYRQAGMYYDTLVNRFHCDSVILINLVITDHYSAWDAIPICPGAQLEIEGHVITKAGLYTFTLPSHTQLMDSLHCVHVYDAPAFDLEPVKREICQGDTVEYGGKKFTTTGNYELRFTSSKGCDSIMHLDLTVYPTYHHDTVIYKTDYDKPIKWFNSTYDSTGVYQHREPTQGHMCDSTFTLKLTVVETQRDTVEDHICSGMSYTWRGKEYSTTGCYRDTVRMLDVKQSYIHTLLLDVKDPIVITSAKIEEDICADAEGFDITLAFRGGTPKKYNIRFDEVAKKAGFVDIEDELFDQTLKAHIALPQFKNVVYQNHTAYVQPNYYSLRVELDNDICGIERSDSIEMLIRYPSWIIEQNWGDIVMPLSAELNGGYEFIKTEWYVNHVLQPTTGTSYLQSPNLFPGDEVVMMAIRKGENKAVPSCAIVISDFSTKVHDTPVIVYPTQAPRHAPVFTIQAQERGTYAIYSFNGLLITEGNLIDGDTQVRLPAVSGMYFIHTTLDNESQTHKVLIY